MSELSLKRILHRAYEMFKLFYKGFHHIMQMESRERLVQVMEEFYTSYLDRLDLTNLDLIHTLGGISYLTVDTPSHSALLSFISELESKFPAVKSTCVLWHHFLVWNSASTSEEIRVLYDYITDPETGKVEDSIINQVKAKGEAVISTRPLNTSSIAITKDSSTASSPSTAPTSISFADFLNPYRKVPSKFSGFIVGPEFADEGRTSSGSRGGGVGEAAVVDDRYGAKKLYIGPKAIEHRVIVYQFQEDTTIVLLLPCDAVDDPLVARETESALQDPSLYVQLRMFLESRLGSVAHMLNDNWERYRKVMNELTTLQYRYFYHNSMTLAFRTSLGVSKSTMVHEDLIQAINDLHEDFHKPSLKVTEVCMKTLNDLWILAKMAGGREFVSDKRHLTNPIDTMLAETQTSQPATTSKPLAKDFSNYLSIDAKAHKPSALKAFFPIMQRKGMLSLAGGLPLHDTFVFQHVTATFKSVHDDNNDQKASETTVAMPLVTDREDVASIKQYLQYGPGKGFAQYVEQVKKVVIGPREPQYRDWDLMATGGNTPTLDSCFRMLFNRGDGILEFTYSSALEQMRPLGIIPVPVKTDDQGMIPAHFEESIEAFKKSGKGTGIARVIYTVPTAQNPTGAVMSRQRREDLLRAAKKLDLLILEDDPYSILELADYQPPEKRDSYVYPGVSGTLPSLFSMDDDGRVILLYTFSKIFAPSVRLGFAAGSKQMIAQLIFYSELVNQLLLQWGAEGFEKHAVELQKHYTERRDWMVDAVMKHLTPAPGQKAPAEFVVPKGGMFFWFKINFPPNAPQGILRQIHDRMIELNVLVAHGAMFIPNPEEGKMDVPYMRVAFSYAGKEDMEWGMRVFVEVLKEFGCGSV
ncbi:Aromatic/aminoadipate aminotransferase 1 [Chytridiales sp. JEL 0842]|nr:Aromatic/aminoadipate aminotransferase 1 [Chytridiales sp. JEL 0842]